MHGSVVKTAWLRDLLGMIAFAQFSLGPKLWRKWHNMEHHGHTQDADHDPDAWATMEELYKRPFLRWVYRFPPSFRAFVNFTSFTLFFTFHALLMFRRFVPEMKPRDRVVAWLQLLLPTGFWLGLLFWMGPARWLFAYVLPLMMANFLVICYISTNHQLNPLVPVNDPLANSLSVTVPRWVDVLHLNFSYHTEHHLFPGMNPRWAPLVKAHIKQLWPDRYHEMPMWLALRTLWRTPRIYFERTDLVDPHRGKGYGSLGHGLDARCVRPHPVQLSTPPAIPKVGESKSPLHSLTDA
jgi:fatty acid desaturase